MYGIIDSMYLPFFIAGFGGGVVRGIVGFIKYQFSYKNVQFDLPYFLTMMFLAGAVGLLTSIAIFEFGVSIFGITQMTPGLAFILGYAGGDMIENAIKIITRRPTLFRLVDESVWKRVWNKFF